MVAKTEKPKAIEPLEDSTQPCKYLVKWYASHFRAECWVRFPKKVTSTFTRRQTLCIWFLLPQLLTKMLTTKFYSHAWRSPSIKVHQSTLLQDSVHSLNIWARTIPYISACASEQHIPYLSAVYMYMVPTFCQAWSHVFVQVQYAIPG